MLAICIAIPFNANAAGIPTIDIAAIAQMIQDGIAQVQRFKEQMDGAKNHLNATKDQSDFYKLMNNDYWDVTSVLSDPEVAEFLALNDWKEVYETIEDIDDLRNEFDMNDDDPKIQERYDKVLKNFAFLKKTYKTSVTRQERIIELTTQLRYADSPAKKADLANALQYEQVQLANEVALTKSMNELMREQQELERKSRMIKLKKQLLTPTWEQDT
ncbi:hypothetical protein TUM4438_31230 [Shewanella sairae]|uniref:Conjugal transfer protein TrbJ n=2 Tax=Shewanella sairae TaxID=190310 RepID=A0ABQ4PLC3_9GAMM|nr:hypothetical protein TUM4438_31230 [Shewanella sairae]